MGKKPAPLDYTLAVKKEYRSLVGLKKRPLFSIIPLYSTQSEPDDWVTVFNFDGFVTTVASIETAEKFDPAWVWISWVIEWERPEGERLRIAVEKITSKLLGALFGAARNGVYFVGYEHCLGCKYDGRVISFSKENLFMNIASHLTPTEINLIKGTLEIINVSPLKRPLEGLPEL